MGKRVVTGIKIFDTFKITLFSSKSEKTTVGLSQRPLTLLLSGRAPQDTSLLSVSVSFVFQFPTRQTSTSS